MTKVAIKNENITSFGGIYHIMDVFSKLGFEKLTESVLGKRGSSGKAFSHGSIFGSLFFSYLCGGECLEDINALIGQFKQRPDTLLPGADTVGRGLKESVEVGYEKSDVTSVSMDNLIEGKSYRLVVQRSPLKGKDGSEQTDMFGVIYTYRCILTNNWTST